MRPTFIVLVLMLAAATGSAAGSPERWVEARSTHFVILTDTSEKDAKRLAGQFERMHEVFHRLLPGQDDGAEPPIVVVALKSKRDMQALEPVEYTAKNQMDLTGFFLRAPDRNYIVLRLDTQQDHAFATVYHEYTHYMLRKVDGWMPLWLNEGLAQFYENTDIDQKNAWLGQANLGVMRYLNLSDLIPIPTLLRIDTRSPYYHEEQKGNIFYAESWALTHYLIVGDRVSATHRVHDYAQRLSQGEDAVTAARAAFGDLDKLQAALSAYVAQRHFLYFMMPTELTAKDAAVEVRPVSTAEADALRAGVLVSTGRTTEAQALAESVLREDPNDAPAHEAMGLLRYGQGDMAAANKWYGKALALNPDSYGAQYFYGLTAMHSGGNGQDAASEAHLRTAIQLNPDFAPAYDALAMLYATRHRNLDEAHALNLRAVELDPGRLSYWLDSAEVLAEDRQFADALAALKAAMHVARTPGEIASVEGRMARVELYSASLRNSYDRARVLPATVVAAHGNGSAQ
jgi:tetratricopeptide (TPR) repeat protein